MYVTTIQNNIDDRSSEKLSSNGYEIQFSIFVAKTTLVLRYKKTWTDKFRGKTENDVVSFLSG